MKRRLLNLLTALSLLLCAGSVVLWVSSRGSRDVSALSDLSVGRRYVAVSSVRGHLEVAYFPSEPVHYVGLGDYTRWVIGRPPFILGTYAGPVGVPTGPGGTRGRVVVVPYWLLIAGGVLLPATRGVQSWRRVRRREFLERRGRCVTCGYDLRCTPGRCPECGAAASVSTRG